MSISSSSLDVVCIHQLMIPFCLFPLWDALVYALPPLYYYKYWPSTALEQQVESLV
jgi:hypothetical protein